MAVRSGFLMIIVFHFFRDSRIHLAPFEEHIQVPSTDKTTEPSVQVLIKTVLTKMIKTPIFKENY